MNRIPLLYIFFFVVVMATWLWYMFSNNAVSLYTTNWVAPFTMVFGSFIAGASSEGGGAVAFPVFTLLLDISPSSARNFSFACQSIGMTAASTLIIGLKIPISWRAIVFTSIGGIIGLLFGTFYVVPYIPNAETKIFFVSLWLSFGFALYLSNRNFRREVFNDLASFEQKDKLLIIVFGIIGGIITAIFGNGIDIFSFCLFTLYYRISEKVATPTSVIIMTINTILGFLLHAFVIQDFQQIEFDFWICSIPVVLIFAPLGAYIINFFTRQAIAKLLYVIIVVQYIGALIVIQPPFWELVLSISVILGGFLFFWWISNKKISNIS